MGTASEQKDRIRLITALAVLASFAAVYAGMCFAESRSRAPVPEMIVPYTADQITSVTWKTDGGETLSVGRSAEGSFILSTLAETEKAIDADRGRTFFASLTGIAVARTIDNAGKLSDYGLDRPKTEAVIRALDGTETGFSISAPDNVTGMVYVTKNGDESRIYAVRSGFGSAFPGTAEFLLNK